MQFSLSDCKSQHRKLTLEKKSLPPLLPGLEPTTFRSPVWCSTTELSLFPFYLLNRCSALPLSYPCSRSTYWTGVLCYYWAIPAPILLTEQVFCATTELSLLPSYLLNRCSALLLSYPCSHLTYWTGVLRYHWAIPAPVLLMNRCSVLPLSYLCSHFTYWTGVLLYHWAIPAPILLIEPVFYLARAACCCSMAFLLCWVTKGCGVMLRKPGDNVTVLLRPNISVLAAGRSVVVWPRRKEPFLPVEWRDRQVSNFSLYRSVEMEMLRHKIGFQLCSETCSQNSDKHDWFKIH